MGNILNTILVSIRQFTLSFSWPAIFGVSMSLTLAIGISMSSRSAWSLDKEDRSSAELPQDPSTRMAPSLAEQKEKSGVKDMVTEPGNIYVSDFLWEKALDNRKVRSSVALPEVLPEYTTAMEDLGKFRSSRVNDNAWTGPSWSYASGGIASNSSALSPAEKYDLWIGADKKRGLAASEREKAKQYQLLYREKEITRVPDHALGMALAGLLEPLPTKPVKVRSIDGKEIVFYPNDIQALGALFYEQEDSHLRRLGPVNGTVNPGALHVDLLNELGIGGRPVLVELHSWREKSWRVAKGFKVSYLRNSDQQPTQNYLEAKNAIKPRAFTGNVAPWVQPEGGKKNENGLKAPGTSQPIPPIHDFGSTFGSARVLPRRYAPRTVSTVDVQLALELAAEADSTLADQGSSEFLNLSYELELDKDDKVVGGELPFDVASKSVGVIWVLNSEAQKDDSATNSASLSKNGPLERDTQSRALQTLWSRETVYGPLVKALFQSAK